MGIPYIFSSSHSYPIAPEIKRQIKCSRAEFLRTWLSLHEFGQIKASGNLKDHHSVSSVTLRIYYEYAINARCEQALIDITIYKHVHFTNSVQSTSNTARLKLSVLVICLFCCLVLHKSCKEAITGNGTI